MPPGNSRLRYQLKIRDDARFEMENCFQLSLSCNAGFRFLHLNPNHLQQNIANYTGNLINSYLNSGSHHHNYYFYFWNNVIEFDSLDNTYIIRKMLMVYVACSVLSKKIIRKLIIIIIKLICKRQTCLKYFLYGS